MKILSFESSAKACSVALLDNGVLVGEYYQNCGQTHSRTLLKMAEDLLENCGVTTVDAVACAAGPGSFTGVRIGVAAAKGYAWGAQIPCVGVSTLEAMAHQARNYTGLICCVMDARRDQVYHGLFSCENGELCREVEDCAISIEELKAELLAYEELDHEFCESVLFIGDGAKLCHKAIDGYECAPEHLCMQRASGVALAAAAAIARGEMGDGATLNPNYLRLSQAERERKEKLQKAEQDESENH